MFESVEREKKEKQDERIPNNNNTGLDKKQPFWTCNYPNTCLQFGRKTAIERGGRMKRASQVSFPKVRFSEASLIARAKEALKLAVNAVALLPKSYSKKTIATDGTIYTMSGWADIERIKDVHRVMPSRVIEESGSISYVIRPHKLFDGKVARQYNASHAEKQLSLLTEKPMGISRKMCSDCINYFRKLAKSKSREIYTADPGRARRFKTDEKIVEY